MISSYNYSGNVFKVSKYLERYKINHDNLHIVLMDGEKIFGPFGYANRKSHYIETKIPKWLFWCKNFVAAKVILHEYYHLCGIDKCESNWFKRLFCIMYENRGKRWKEILIKPLQLLNGLRPCKKCRKII